MWSRQQIIGAIVVVGLSLLSGCATLGPAYKPESGSAADKATIYVYRDFNVFGGGATYMVSGNGVPIASLPAGGYFVYHAPPGEVQLSAKSEATTSVTVEAKAGEVYYVKGTIGVGILVGRPHLLMVTNEVGAKEIASCKLVPESMMANAQTGADFTQVTVPADEGAVRTFGSVTWYSGVDVLANSSTFVEAGEQAIKGTLELTDRSLTLLTGSEAGTRTGMGLRIPYSEIASVDIRHHINWHAVVIKRRDGKIDSFNIFGGIFIDRKQTEAAGELLQSKIQTQPVTGQKAKESVRYW